MLSTSGHTRGDRAAPRARLGKHHPERRRRAELHPSHRHARCRLQPQRRHNYNRSHPAGERPGSRGRQSLGHPQAPLPTTLRQHAQPAAGGESTREVFSGKHARSKVLMPNAQRSWHPTMSPTGTKWSALRLAMTSLCSLPRHGSCRRRTCTPGVDHRLIGIPRWFCPLHRSGVLKSKGPSDAITG